MNDILNYITRGEWNCGTEEKLYKSFFRLYRLKAMSYPDFRLEEIYDAVYVPFVIEKGYRVKKLYNVFNTLEDGVLLYYCNKRHEFLKQNKLNIIKKDILNFIYINDKLVMMYNDKQQRLEEVIMRF